MQNLGAQELAGKIFPIKELRRDFPTGSRRVFSSPSAACAGTMME
jgi:hypothetical protein